MTERVVVSSLDVACEALVRRIAAIRHPSDRPIPDSAIPDSANSKSAFEDRKSPEGRPGGGAVRVQAADVPRRLLVAIAGPPAGGKSTLAAALVEAFDDAVLVPMDGFHLDDALLRPAGLLARKGSPETFDVDGFVALLDRIRDDDGRAVHVPVFDRARELARAGAATVAPTHRTVVVEGNYLLLDEPPWRALATRFDLTIMLGVEEAVLRERLVRRWLENGFGEEEALARAERNDLPNGRRSSNGSIAADLELTTAGH